MRRVRNTTPAKGSEMVNDQEKAKEIGQARQSFVLSRYTGDEDFKADGLRPYGRYRDLGFAHASEGAVHAHVIRLIPPCTDAVRHRHRHMVNFQMFYVLKGWLKIEFEGEGEVIMRQGDCAMMPPGIRHTVLDYSDDFENLEIVMPEKFETIDA